MNNREEWELLKAIPKTIMPQGVDRENLYYLHQIEKNNNMEIYTYQDKNTKKTYILEMLDDEVLDFRKYGIR